MGDIVNSSRKERFKKTTVGSNVDNEYKEQMKNLTFEDKYMHDFSQEIDDWGLLDDAHLMQMLYDIRQYGYEAYLLPQRHDLPFGYTRDDILIYAW